MDLNLDNIILVTGGFDPIHSGHLLYLEEAKKLGGCLVVGLNSDQWLSRKKGKPFLPFKEREAVLRNIKFVDVVIDFNDSDDTARDAIIQTRKLYPHKKIIFANGGDRTIKNIPELDLELDNLEFVFGVGGVEKKNSSSAILNNWSSIRTDRPWGYFKTIHEIDSQIKVKELVVFPNCALSMQKHVLRSEFWFVLKGTASIYTSKLQKRELVGLFNQYQTFNIKPNQWHQLANETNEDLRILEVQHGSYCSELDIERFLSL